MPIVSVIMPTYNRAGFIHQSIQSALDQTYTDFEIIIVDDGSTDNTKEVVNGFKDNRITYIYQMNQGVCVARNTGIKAAHGKYIVFLDSDDILFKHSLEKGVKILENNPEVGLCYGQKYLIDEKGHFYAKGKVYNRKPGVWQGTKEILKLFYCNNYISPSHTIIPRNVILEVGLFNPAFSAGSEDFDLWVRIAKRYSVFYFAEPFAKWRVHIGSISAKRSLYEHAKSHRRIYSSFFKDPKFGKLFSSQKPKAYFFLHLRFAAYAFSEGNKELSRKYLFKALKIYPRSLMEKLFFRWIYLVIKTYIPMQIIRLVRGIKKSYM